MLYLQLFTAITGWQENMVETESPQISLFSIDKLFEVQIVLLNFKGLFQINFPEKSLIFDVQKQPQDKRSLWKNSIKHSQKSFRFELHIAAWYSVKRCPA